MMNINNKGRFNMEFDFSEINNYVIYYAHHMCKYNTKEESNEIDLIKCNFISSTIINPNGWIYECGNESIIINQCLQLINNSDIVVFSTINDGIIGKGVYTELEHAYRKNKQVYMIASQDIIRFTRRDFNNIDVIYNEINSWRKYARIKHKAIK